MTSSPLRYLTFAIFVALWSPVHARADVALAKSVEAFVSAFNARRVDVMLDAVADDIELVWIEGGVATVDTSGREALRRFLVEYFSANANVRSELTWISASRERVAAMETVQWTGAKGRRARSSLSVYEFSDGKIRRVWYFPSESGPSQS